MTDFNEFFNQAAAETVESAIDTTYAMHHGDLLKLGIVSIQPTKKELEAVGNVPIGTDPRTLVPWKDGISLNCLVTRVKSANDAVIKMIDVDADGKIVFPNGTFNIDRYVRINAKDITGGFVRLPPDENGRTSKILWPADWDRLTPTRRLAYWLEWAAFKYGLPKGAVQEGTVFYAFHVVRRGKEGSPYEGKVFSDVAARIQDEATGTWVSATNKIESMPIESLRMAKAELNRLYEEYKARKEQQETSFNYGSNYSEDAGF